MEAAVKLALDGHEELGAYGRLLLDLGRAPEAVTALRRATEVAPKCPNCPTNLSLALRALQRPDDAKAAAEEALRRNPEHYQARDALGNAYVSLERLPE